VKVCEEGKLLHPITTPIKRASFYTGMPWRTIQRIKRERENNPECVLKSPLKRRRPSKKKAEIDSIDRNVICMTMVDFYIGQKIVPSVRKFLVAKSFHRKKMSLLGFLHDMGFTWKRSVGKRKVLLDRRDIDWRCR
jgi:hypothetical protein